LTKGVWKKPRADGHGGVVAVDGGNGCADGVALIPSTGVSLTKPVALKATAPTSMETNTLLPSLAAADDT
jgi:hypothetical protein